MPTWTVLPGLYILSRVIVNMLFKWVKEIPARLTELICSEVLSALRVIEFNAVSTLNVIISLALYEYG
jgi:hypothetical protein